MDEAGTQPAQNACVSQNGFVVHAKLTSYSHAGLFFDSPWLLILFWLALAGSFLMLYHRFSLDLFAKWACRRNSFLQHAPSYGSPIEECCKTVGRSGGIVYYILLTRGGPRRSVPIEIEVISYVGGPSDSLIVHQLARIQDSLLPRNTIAGSASCKPCHFARTGRPRCRAKLSGTEDD